MLPIRSRFPRSKGLFAFSVAACTPLSRPAKEEVEIKTSAEMMIFLIGRGYQMPFINSWIEKFFHPGGREMGVGRWRKIRQFRGSRKGMRYLFDLLTLTRLRRIIGS